MTKKKTIIVSVIAIIIIAAGLVTSHFYFSKPCEHKWEDASCEDPVTCVLCGETAGNPIGHIWVDATYTSPKTCSICGKTEGSVLAKPEDEPTKPTERKCLLCDSKVSRSNTLYCSTHDCGNGNCPYPAKNVRGCEWGSLCEFHSCRYPDCTSIPTGGTNYCGAHGG